MSRVETLDKDFRVAALGAMQCIADMTAYPGELHAALARVSAATVFVSLLANEAQQLQFLACTCLANSMCWEGWTGSAAAGGEQSQSQSQSVVRRHVELCDGHKVLLGLLTSPSASINLAGTQRGGASTAPIQGMCNREGARALVNMFLPQLRVPPSAGAGPGARKGGGAAGCASAASVCSKAADQLMHEVVISEWPRLRAWKFVYVSRSGAVKDEFTSYLTFSADGRCLGRGCDSVGFFVLEGASEVDIQGRLFKLAKKYVSQSAMEEQTSLRVLQALQDGGEAGVGAGAGLGADAGGAIQRAHVMHTAYYTDGLTAESVGDARWGGGEVSSLGLFGVWEGAEAGSHFQLQKGGVFRAVPLWHINS